MNYYDELIQNIEKYIENEEYDLAKSTILNELNMPYVPKDLENKLYEYLNIIKTKLFVIKSISDDEIVKYLNDNEEKQLIAVDELSKRNLRDYIDICSDFISDKGKYANAKALLIDSLIRQEINYEFAYVNDSSLLKFNPCKLPIIEKSEGFIVANAILNDYYMKNPSQLNIAVELLYKESLMTLPYQIDGNEISKKIINYIDKAFSAK